MPWFRNQIYDERISIWTKQAGARTSTTAIISAHGEDAIINAFWPNGQFSLVYFCPHGYDLGDPTLANLWGYRVQYEVRQIQHAPNLKQNYHLTKYQGRHSHSAETYDSITELPDTDGPDIITVSNLKGFSLSALLGEGVLLSTLVSQVLAEGYDYTIFQCAFCRGDSMFGTNPSVTPNLL